MSLLTQYASGKKCLKMYSQALGEIMFIPTILGVRDRVLEYTRDEKNSPSSACVCTMDEKHTPLTRTVQSTTYTLKLTRIQRNEFST